MRTRIFALAALVLALAAIVVAADDPFVGTWKLNVGKSRLNPPIPKSSTLKVTAQDNSFEWAFDTLESDGKATHSHWSGKYDGRDYTNPGDPDIDTVATKRMNANNLNTTFKRGGKVVGAGQCLVSKDGKTLTLTEDLKNAQGKERNSLWVYDKQ
jgi:hypothetical protein